MRQSPLDLGHELVVDLFAGGGGASLGIEWGLGRAVDIAVNHDCKAIAMHTINHPETTHYVKDVWEVDPVAVTRNQPVGLLWLSPDCKHFSKAKGGRPVSKKIRGLAWVGVRWIKRTRPRLVILENVEEFQSWGPVSPDGKPCPARKGQEFARFVDAIRRQGYQVEYRELKACDFGSPTIRKRLFLIARRDGLPIVWPEPTHGPGLEPFRTAAECIDWTIPVPSIFERKKPLADNTLARIRKGVHRFVLEAEEPYFVGDIVPWFIPRHGERPGQEPRTRSVQRPFPVITATANGASLVAAFLAQHNTGMVGHDVRKPVSTITGTGSHQQLVAAHLLNLKGSARRHRAIDLPAPTVTAGGNHAALVAAFMAPYYGQGSGLTGRDLRDPSPTITTKDRLQLVTVTIAGDEYVLVDIGMRMFTPRELFRLQGFPDDYIIDHGIDLKGEDIAFTKSEQVRMCGNSVPPHFSAALVRANFRHERSQGVSAA